MKYFGNTMNMRYHISGFHLQLKENLPVIVAAPYQRKMQEELSKFPSNSEKAKLITKSNAIFIAKDLFHYSVIEKKGFWDII